MDFLLLTKNSTFIIGPVAWLLGKLMEGIFWVQNLFINLFHLDTVPNIGISIIIFTVIIYLLLLPLTIKQQKFSKLSAKMNPEIQAIQAKYKGKKDTESMEKMNNETQAVYAKYGVNPMGSCLQLLIQMPILFALYRVIYAIPAYVPEVKNVFTNLVNRMMGISNGTITDTSSYVDSINFFNQVNEKGRPIISSVSSFSKQMSKDMVYDVSNLDQVNINLITGADAAANIEKASNTFIDIINRFSRPDWDLLKNHFANMPDMGTIIDNTQAALAKYNFFLGLDIGYSPLDTIKTQWASDSRNWLIIIVAVLIPILAAVTQWVGVKLAPQPDQNSNNNQDNPMMSSLKSMNTIMPLMSAVFCFTLPAGMGLYWIVGAVVRAVQQVIINKYIDSLDIDKVIEKNTAKYEAKMKKKGLYTSRTSPSKKSVSKDPQAREEEVKKAQEYLDNLKKKDKKSNTSGGSLAAKARIVKEYNEKNNK